VTIEEFLKVIASHLFKYFVLFFVLVVKWTIIVIRTRDKLYGKNFNAAHQINSVFHVHPMYLFTARSKT